MGSIREIYCTGSLPYLYTMVHRGEIIKKAVHESGYSITTLAKKMKKSRRWVYYIFEKPNVSLDVVLDIGKLLHYDFSPQMKGVSLYTKNTIDPLEFNALRKFETVAEELIYWKEQFYTLLEKYNNLLERN